MSDWSLYEFENIPWNEFGTCDDHIVPHQSVGLVNKWVAPCDSHKKPRKVLDVGKRVNSRGSDTKTVLQEIEGTYLRTPMRDEKCRMLEGLQSHASENVVPGSCNPICGIGVPTDGCKTSYLSLDGVLPAPINLDYLGSENNDKENDLVYYDLPDIDNFEDIDRMFRDCDATFEERLMGTADHLSWFSTSSNTIYGSEVTIEPGLQSSCSKLSSLKSTSGHLLDTDFLSRSDQPTTNHEKRSSLCYQPYADWLDKSAVTMDESAHNKRVNDQGNGGEISATAHIIGENVLGGHKNPDMINVHLKKMESQYPAEEIKVQQYADQKCLPFAVSTQACSSQHLSKQMGSASSSYMHVPQMEYMHPVRQVPFSQTPSVKFECESVPSSSYVSDKVMNQVPQYTQSFPDQMYKPPIVRPEMLEKHHRHLCDVDPSIAQESSFITYVCPDDISVEATSFRQLQDVMEQMDIRTKLCIRDSLYRLARSAQQRHDFTNTNDCNGVSKDARRIQCTEAPKNCSEFMDDAETVTNPIDRSIAHLLFTGLPDPATGSG